MTHAPQPVFISYARRTNTEAAVAFYRSKKQFSGLGIQELRELRSLRHENAKLNLPSQSAPPCLTQDLNTLD